MERIIKIIALSLVLIIPATFSFSEDPPPEQQGPNFVIFNHAPQIAGMSIDRKDRFDSDWTPLAFAIFIARHDIETELDVNDYAFINFCTELKSVKAGFEAKAIVDFWQTQYQAAPGIIQVLRGGDSDEGARCMKWIGRLSLPDDNGCCLDGFCLHIVLIKGRKTSKGSGYWTERTLFVHYDFNFLGFLFRDGLGVTSQTAFDQEQQAVDELMSVADKLKELTPEQMESLIDGLGPEVSLGDLKATLQ